jgi:chromosome segregation ATPase
MNAAPMSVVFFLLLVGAPAASAANMDPLGKVFQLMADLEAKITKEGEEEAKAFNDYVEWCDDAAANLHNEIKTGTEKKEELEATISKCKADIEACSVKIEELSGSIAADEKELAEATAVREKEVATFEASEKELVDAIDTLERAVGILQKEMSKSPASLAQVDTSNLDSVLKGLDAVINAASFLCERSAETHRTCAASICL